MNTQTPRPIIGIAAQICLFALLIAIFGIGAACGGSGGGGGTGITGSSPVSVNLTATPSSITPGQTTTLQWTSTNATTVQSSNFGATTVSGTVRESPTTTTPYSITVADASGNVATDTVTVTVGAANPQPTVAIFVSPTTISIGQTATLTWSSTNAATASTNFGSTTTSGSISVHPTASTTYTITVTSAGGLTAHAQATLTVTNTAAYKVLRDYGQNPGEISLALSDGNYIALGTNAGGNTPGTTTVFDNNGNQIAVNGKYWFPQINDLTQTGKEQIAGDAIINGADEITVFEPNVNAWTPAVINGADFGVSLNNNGDVLYYDSTTNMLHVYSTTESGVLFTPFPSGVGNGVLSNSLSNHPDEVAGQQNAPSGPIVTYINGNVTTTSVTGTPIDLADNGALVVESGGNTTVYSISTMSPMVPTLSGFSTLANLGARVISNNSDQRIIGQTSTNAFAVYDFAANAILPIALPTGDSMVALGAINASNNIAAIVNENGTPHLVVLTPDTTPALAIKPTTKVAPVPAISPMRSIRKSTGH